MDFQIQSEIFVQVLSSRCWECGLKDQHIVHSKLKLILPNSSCVMLSKNGDTGSQNFKFNRNFKFNFSQGFLSSWSYAHSRREYRPLWLERLAQCPPKTQKGKVLLYHKAQAVRCLKFGLEPKFQLLWYKIFVKFCPRFWLRAYTSMAWKTSALSLK